MLRSTVALVAVLGAVVAAAPAAANPANPRIYATTGANLVSFNAQPPHDVTTVALSGFEQPGKLVALDFRPAGGELFGLATETGFTNLWQYRIDPESGAME